MNLRLNANRLKADYGRRKVLVIETKFRQGELVRTTRTGEQVWVVAEISARVPEYASRSVSYRLNLRGSSQYQVFNEDELYGINEYRRTY